jgi:hypothetical protein
MNGVPLQKGGLLDRVLKAVIIYDDFDSATRATALLERVAVRADEEIKWDIKPWKFDVLKQPTLAALTVAVAANADLIVLALRRIHSTPTELLDWLEDWAKHRRIEDACVLALYSYKTHTPSMPLNKLRIFAEEQHLTLLDSRKVRKKDGNPAPFVHRLQQRKRLVVSAASPPGPSFAERLPIPHHWGINE